MRVAVLLSGGVDSSVALRRLHAEGHEVHAFYLKIWLEDELAHLGACPWEEDLRYARAVCRSAGVPLEVVPLQREYHERVVAWTIAELAAGRTPSPDILCNRRVKFGIFLEHLEGTHALAFDRVATGHYARLDVDGQGPRLLKGRDPVKDQTYFLFGLHRAQLGRLLFPLGELEKAEVRALARRFELPNHDRRDSQGICFLGKLSYDELVEAYLGERPGEIREIGSGRRLGEHRGYWFHTVGQRKGLGLHGGPWYVVAKDVAENVVWVAHRRHLGRHRRRRFQVAELHWIQPPRREDLDVRVRHSPSVLPCRITPHKVLPQSEDGLEVELRDDDPGLAAGQWAVFYDGEECLGGGMIVDS